MMNGNRFLCGACWLVALAAAAGLGGCVAWPQTYSCPPVHPANARVEALQVLEKASQSSNAFTRAHVIEAMAATLGPEAGEVHERGLRDPDPAVRYAAAVAVGDLKYAPAKARLIQMARDKTVETDRRVMPGVIYALYELGDEDYTSQLGQLLFDKEKEVRANAAMAMGRMGEPSATNPLRSLKGQELDDRVRVAIYEALALLGDEASAYLLESYARTTFLDMRLAAITAMSQFPSPRAEAVMRQLMDERRNPPQARVAAAGALARMGMLDEDAYQLAFRAACRSQKMLEGSDARDGEVTAAEVDQLQQLAAVALGYMDRPQAIDALYLLTQDENPDVQVAAAMGILRQVPIAAGVPTGAPTGAPASQQAPAGPVQPAPGSPPRAATAPDEEPNPIAPAPMPKLQTSGAKE